MWNYSKALLESKYECLVIKIRKFYRSTAFINILLFFGAGIDFRREK